MSKVNLNNEDMGIDYRDAGPWRNYELTTQGDTMEECIREGVIAEVDQDGEVLDTHGIETASRELMERAFEMISIELKR